LDIILSITSKKIYREGEKLELGFLARESLMSSLKPGETRFHLLASSGNSDHSEAES
jgi:hypothetical protein